ncbi:NADH-quinone oxidoreductase subunit N [Leekyejoonella antrihumi]|uniref:NADH:quinone oxidoreductase/Mrp antiporter transmembrane domain-containing protein n=1 Tax=Leekyejoonella antrihumi TaxID=1660198 RepID=A0A563E670_9MICO|nr:proton-conducting transporter membrane subunit [Leekyejoonella antrihumi]TWP37334.1 hypothetical protein FGL98_06160 [Leekyejoonella antrihumi]
MSVTYNWALLAPVAVPALGAVLLLVIDLCLPRLGRLHWILAAIILLAGAAFAVPLALPGADSPRRTLCLPNKDCLYLVDHVGVGLQLAALVSAAVVALLAFPIKVPGERAPVLGALVLTAAAGASGVAAAGDLGSWLVMLEVATLPTVVLVALRARRAAIDGALSLLTVSLVSFAILAMGAAMWFAATGGGLLNGGGLLQAAKTPDSHRILVLAMMFIIAGLAFKLSLAPFHSWTPEAVGGASTPIGAYLVVTSKVAALAALLVMVRSMNVLGNPVLGVLGVLAAVSMTLGNVMALREQSTLRFLAWSTVAQAGWVVLPLATVSSTSLRSAAGYLVVYSLATLVAFAVVTAIAHADGRGAATRLRSFGGLLRRRPVLGAALGLALLVLAGLPPGVVGLVAKVLALSPVAGNRLWVLAVVAALNAMLGVAVYLRWLRIILGERQEPVARGRIHPVHTGLVLAGLAGLVVTSFAPQLLLSIVGG